MKRSRIRVVWAMVSGASVATGALVGCTSSVSPGVSIDAGFTWPDAATPAQDASPTNTDAAATDASHATDAGGDANTAGDAGGTVSVPRLPPTTAAMSGPGLSDCGPAGSESCATTIEIPGGSFGMMNESTATTVSPFRLDKYEVTVGRFRAFVAAWLGGWRPAAGAGKHLHVNGGRGLARVAGGFEEGWPSAWNGWVGTASQAANPVASVDAAAWSGYLACSTSAAWTTSATTHEAWPVNCANGYEAFAFCIWDGGFLPSEIEWDFAARGGSEQRVYPWGAAVPDPTRALYGSTKLEPVGGRPAGNGRWGQADLLGSLQELVFDARATQYARSCTDCAQDFLTNERTLRSTGFTVSQTTVQVSANANRSGMNMDNRIAANGFRCARP